MNQDDQQASVGGDPLWEEHLRTYSKPGLPRFTYQEIGTDQRLWHGRNPLTAVDVAELAQRGITHILDLREEWEWSDASRFGAEAVAEIERCGIIRRHIPVRDLTPLDMDQFTEGVHFLEEVYSDPESRIYVHCRMGLQRTGSMLAAWWGHRQDLTVDEAVDILNAAGAIINPLPEQRAAVQRWLDQAKQSEAESP